MSSDPVAVILDKVTQWKGDATEAVRASVDVVAESSFYKSLLQVLSRSKGPSTVLARRPPPPPQSVWTRCSDWVANHKLLTAFVVLGVGSGTAYCLYISYPGGRKKRRRAKTASNGARSEVVVIAGSPVEPITRIVASDLNRRGFIVYWTTSSAEEEAIVRRENSPDIRSLHINVTDVGSIEKSTAHIQGLLDTPVAAFPGAEPHQLHLAGVLVVPDLYYPAGPLESMRVDTWSDLVYSKILGPVFLLTNGLIDLVRRHNSRIILMTPSIIGALNPAFHAPEALATNALGSIALCLQRELAAQNISVVHLQLGSFDVSHGRPQESRIASSVRADILSWSQKVRNIYARSYQASSHLMTSRAYGSNIRVLHRAVFDALTDPRPARIWYVGQGSYAYHFLANWVPESLMTWLLHPHKPKADPVESGWESV